MSILGREKIVGFTDEEFKEKVNKANKELVNDFLKQSHLSEKTLKQYKSALYIFCKWVHEECGEDEKIPELRPRHALRFQNFMIDSGLSSSGIKFKRSAVSSLFNFIEVYWSDEYPSCRNIYTKAIPSVENIKKKEKVPLTPDEITRLIDVLTERKDWQKIAYLRLTYITGCRREESRQFLKEIINHEKVKDKDGKQKKYYVTNKVRAKGRGREGKERRFKFNDEAMDAIKKWVEYRGTQVTNDDCPYLFVSKTKDGYKQVHPNTFNLWCEDFTEILDGKLVFPHLLRSSRATNAVLEDGVDVKAVQDMLGHKSSETTEIYIVREEEDLDDDLY